MIPLKVAPGARIKPYLTRLLIGVNVLVFGMQWLSWMLFHHDIAATLGVRPSCYFHPSSCGIDNPLRSNQLWLPLLVSLFLHANVLHLAFNMLFLAVFGAGLEETIGRVRTLLLYFGGGFVATAAHIATHPGTMAPVIGASGAIAALLGAFFVVLPRSWVLTYFPPVFILPVPAALFLLVWAAGQWCSALDEFAWTMASASGGIAWMAHLGGFACGACYGWRIKPWRRRSGKRRHEARPKPRTVAI